MGKSNGETMSPVLQVRARGRGTAPGARGELVTRRTVHEPRALSYSSPSLVRTSNNPDDQGLRPTGPRGRDSYSRRRMLNRPNGRTNLNSAIHRPATHDDRRDVVVRRVVGRIPVERRIAIRIH